MNETDHHAHDKRQIVIKCLKLVDHVRDPVQKSDLWCVLLNLSATVSTFIIRWTGAFMGLLLHCPSLQLHRRYATCLFVLLGLCSLLFKLSQTDNFGKHPPRDLKQIKIRWILLSVMSLLETLRQRHLEMWRRLGQHLEFKFNLIILVLNCWFDVFFCKVQN